MPRDPLTITQIQDLSRLLRIAYAQTTAFHEHTPLGKHIKYPPIPQMLSESIALYYLEQGLIPDLIQGTFKFGPKQIGPDVVYESRNAPPLNIEVKATGAKAFQRWSKGDLSADYLIWLHFDKYFESNAETPIEIHVVPQLGQFFSSTGHVSLKNFLIKTQRVRKTHAVYLDQLWSKQKDLFTPLRKVAT